MSSPKLDQLKQLKAIIHPGQLNQNGSIYYQKAALELPKASLIEVAGSGKTQFIVDLIKEQPQFQVFWWECPFQLYPPELYAQGLCLEHILFSDTQENGIWALQTALKSTYFDLVVAHQEQFSLKELRRFQLAIKNSKALFCWLSPQLHYDWPVRKHIQVEKKDGQSFTAWVYK